VGSYSNYLRWLGTLDRERAEVYWQRVLHGCQAMTPLAIERSQPTGAHRYEYHSLVLDADLTAKLKSATEARRLTQATLIQGAWGLLLSRYSGRRDVLFGTTVSGREGNVADIENMVGLFINFLPVRLHLGGDRDVWTLLQALQVEQVAAREHQHIPLTELQRIAAVEAPLYRSMVIFENYPFDPKLFDGSGLSVAFGRGANPTNYPLWVTAVPGQQISISIDYNAAHFDPHDIGQMAAHLEELLRGMVAAPAPRLEELLALLGPESRFPFVGSSINL
jgi:non-ribosomal peptide synthetase component F